MAAYGSTDAVRARARRDYFDPARLAGKSHVVIRSGDFNKTLVSDRLIEANRLPLICNALKSTKLLRENHAVLEKIEGPASGLSSTVVFTYRLEDSGAVPSPSDETVPTDQFTSLRGLLRENYEKLDGADAFHARERAEWEK